MKTSEFLKREILKKYQSLRIFADEIEMPYTTLMTMLKAGINKSSVDNVIRVARGLNLTVNELMGECEDEVECQSIRVPILGTIAAGTPILAEENIEEYFSIDPSVKCDFGLRVKGNSMINADIFEDDIVFIRKQSTLENGQIGAILLENEATLKRFSKTNGNVILQAENPNLTDWPRVYSSGDIKILGKLVGVYSKKE